MQHTVVCESLLETHLNEDFESSTQQAEKPRIALRDKTDGSRKRPAVGTLLRPTTFDYTKRQFFAKPRKYVKAADRKHLNTAVASNSIIRRRLLADIIKAFKVSNTEKMRSKQLLAYLCIDLKGPWAVFCGGNNPNCRRLSALLKDFGIHSKDMRFNTKSYKGYQKEWFVEARRRLIAQK